MTFFHFSLYFVFKCLFQLLNPRCLSFFSWHSGSASGNDQLGKGLLGQWRKTLRSRFLLLELSVIQVLRECKSMKSIYRLNYPASPPPPKCTRGLVILSFLSLLVTVLNKIVDKPIKFLIPAASWIPNMDSPNCNNLFCFVCHIVLQDVYVAFVIKAVLGGFGFLFVFNI